MRGSNFVYDIAFDIEDDLNELSVSLGKSTTMPLIHKIVNVLEKLEQHSQYYDIKSKQICELKESINFLESNKICKEQERTNHQKELEKMEDAWHNESMQLLTNIERLEEENNNLKNVIQQMSEKPRTYCRQRFNEELEIKNVHLKLKETIDLQVDELMSLKKDISQKCLDIDAMQQQCLNLSNVNAEICEKYCYSRNEAKRLIEEKTSLEARLLIECRSLGHCHTNDDVFTGPRDITDHRQDQHFSWDEMRVYLQERDRLRSEVCERKEQLLVYKPNTYGYSDDEVQGPINKEPRDKMSPLSPKELGIKRFFQKLIPLARQ